MKHCQQEWQGRCVTNVLCKVCAEAGVHQCFAKEEGHRGAHVCHCGARWP